MSPTTPEPRLSEPHRLALRAFAALLDAHAGAARRAAFAARRTLPRLQARERHALARWLAWQALAAATRGNPFALARIHRTDAALGRAAEAMLARLPSAGAPAAAGILHRSTQDAA
ncbi:hypothetical protein MBSD_n1867 [Mizugakiibacter sediminis]|uniref:Uncharacterized protein n=2 Tax=Mizugakiibacter sediminis TaxID=1475481 RepID=A0A0K8QNV2_9GAMM|nr:hypothetical protein MBSD_n1867 [Mizugakiibacter sediminis]